MADRPIASDLSYEVIQQQRREAEGLALESHEAHQVTRPITGTRFDELVERLGGRAPLVHENSDGLAGRHGE